MNNITWMFFLGLLGNLPSLVPLFFLRKTSKNVKLSMALRLFLLNALLLLSIMTASQNTTQKYGLYPVWLVVAAIGLFAFTLVPTIKFIRKYLSVGQSRAVILSSFLIVYAVRINSVFSGEYGIGYAVNAFNTVWTIFFLIACLLAYLSCAGSKTYPGYSPSYYTSQPDNIKWSKEFASQSEIDVDIALKGQNVLLDPNLTLGEQQRYKDALREKERDSEY